MTITNPVLMFAFILSTILFIPLFFERIRLPGIVGLIVSGIIVGPHALGILQSEDSFRLLSSVGLIYIMFLAGLEINLSEFNRQKKFSIVFGLLTFLIPMFFGTLASRFLFSFSWPTALLLASMFASHTLIPFPIISRLGINKERAVIATVGGTILTDTAAMLVLAIIAESAIKDLTGIFWVRQIIFLIALIWFALWILPRIAYAFFKMLAPNGESEFLLTLALVFLTSHFAYLAGVEPIIGAFFAGLSLSRLIPEQSSLKNRLEFLGNTFFIPFFLISVGMLVNLKGMFSGGAVWAMALFMITAVILCKYLAAFISAKLLKFTNDEMNLIFGLSVNQAAATLAAVIVGFRLGIFNETVLNGTIFMILITCLIGPWFTEKYGQNIARTCRKMIPHTHIDNERIMLAVSHSESAEFLIDVALSLRMKDSVEPIFPLYIVQDGVDIDRRILAGEKVLGNVVNRIVAANVTVSPVSRIDINIPGGILRALKEYHADVAILGAVSPHESNLKTMLFDVSDKVCDESRQLLFLCQMARPLSIGKNIFVFIPPMLEYREGFTRALESIINLASINKLHLRIIGMVDAIKSARMICSKKGSSLAVSFSALDQWKDCSIYLKKTDLKEADSIILMAVRKGRLGWNPSLKRSFQRLGSGFPENNIMMLYLPENDLTLEDSGSESQKGIPESAVLLSRPAVALDLKSLENAVPQLLESHFLQNSKIIPEVMKKLFPLEPIELSSGIILLHTHSEHLVEPVILLGQAHPGIVFSSLQKVRALFILISPKDQTNIHLQALAKVARMARDLENRKSET